MLILGLSAVQRCHNLQIMATAATCNKCKDNFLVNSKSVTCSSCNGIFHNMCVKVRDSVSKVISDNSNVLWFCDVCLIKIKDIVKSESRVNKSSSSQKALEVEVFYLKKLLKKVKDKNSLLKSNNDLLQKRVSSLEDEIASRVGNVGGISNGVNPNAASATSPAPDMGAIGKIEEFFQEQ